MKMEKGKLYTVVGIDGVQLSRTKGLSVLYNGVKMDNSAIDQAAWDTVVDNTEVFLNDGIDMLVEADYQDGKLVATRSIGYGANGDFDDFFEDYDVEDEDESDEDDSTNIA